MGNILKYLGKLHKPTSKSHKGQNGLALIVAGGEKYHGSAVLSVLAATRFCDLVYFYSPSAKVEFLARKATPCVICISKKELSAHIRKADAILIGPGMEVDAYTKKLVHAVISSGKKCVLDATGIRCAKLSELHKNCVLTPHVREFESAFGLAANAKNAKFCAKKYKCNILLKGRVDTVAGFDGKSIEVSGGNAGLTKGGTGDTLAGLLCALLCKNEAFASMCAASYVNKKAGERLAKKFGMNYSALDVANEVSPALFKLNK
ncbi:ADP-dependent (S)-NAD(P)H-hydrate dehydratase [Candidatus Anstonella stagnisolia]|nr:ADP-dependent (S)-NAD(P)H-hydrate dehydratase [Candidatus Anstonella stagnisolia]